MINIREGQRVDIREIARVHVNSWKSSFRGLIDEDFLQKLSLEKAIQSWEKIFAKKEVGHFIFVAEVFGKDLVGFISGGVPRDEELDYEREIYAIYVDPNWEGKGIGRKMLETVREAFQTGGVDSFYLWTLVGSKSRRFYEACGGKWEHQKTEIIGGKRYELAGYVWKIEE